MNKVSNFLWKLFSVTMAFFYYVENNQAWAVQTIDETTADAATRAPNCSTEAESPTNSQLREICPKGTYLFSCRGFKVGTAWLKPMQYTFRNTVTDENGETEEQYLRTTRNYFDYSDDYMVNIKNLKLFFGATTSAENGGIMYYTEENSNGKTRHMNVSEYKISRDMILSQFCNPLDPNYEYKCAPCPWPGTTTEASTVKVQFGKVLCDTWNVNTFADCHLDSFEDSTGKYVYQNEASSVTQPCYYSNSDNSKTYGTELIDDETRVTNNTRYYVDTPFSSSSTNKRYY